MVYIEPCQDANFTRQIERKRKEKKSTEMAFIYGVAVRKSLCFQLILSIHFTNMDWLVYNKFNYNLNGGNKMTDLFHDLPLQNALRLGANINRANCESLT